MNEQSATLPGIALFPVESSQLSAAGYDPVSKTLAIQFKGKGSEGRTYRYHDVPEAVWDGFNKAKSKGVYFYGTIKPAFGFTRIEADGEITKQQEKPADTKPSESEPEAA